MLVSEFREYAANLGRFANVREKTPPPADRIAIQKRDGNIKFAASMPTGTLIVDAGEDKGKGEGLIVVPARPFLLLAKALRGKDEVTIDLSDTGAWDEVAIVRSKSIDHVILPPTDNTASAILYRPPDSNITAFMRSPGFWPSASKLLTIRASEAVGGYRQVYFELDDQHIIFRAGDHGTATEIVERAIGVVGFRGSLAPEFFEALKGFEEESEVRFDTSLFSVRMGNYTAVTPFMEGYPRFPAVPKLGQDAPKSIKIDKGIIADFKRVAESDEFGRVVLRRNGEGADIRPFSSRVVEHEARVDSNRAIDAIKALDGKQIHISWGDTGPIIFSDVYHSVAVGRIKVE